MEIKGRALICLVTFLVVAVPVGGCIVWQNVLMTYDLGRFRELRQEANLDKSIAERTTKEIIATISLSDLTRRVLDENNDGSTYVRARIAEKYLPDKEAYGFIELAFEERAKVPWFSGLQLAGLLGAGACGLVATSQLAWCAWKQQSQIWRRAIHEVKRSHGAIVTFLRRRKYAALCLAAAPVLVAGLVNSSPHGYYQFLRVVVTTAALFGAVFAWKDRRRTSAVFYISVAIIFNPVAPLEFRREVWFVLDCVTVLFFLAAGLFLNSADVPLFSPKQRAVVVAGVIAVCVSWCLLLFGADGVGLFSTDHKQSAPQRFITPPAFRSASGQRPVRGPVRRPPRSSYNSYPEEEDPDATQEP